MDYFKKDKEPADRLEESYNSAVDKSRKNSANYMKQTFSKLNELLGIKEEDKEKEE